MPIREASIADIPQIQRIRHSVRENVLSNPALVTDQDCEEYLSVRGKGWVYDVNDQLVGFAIADLLENNIWALFLHPDYEARGIGKQLHNRMLDWYFSNTQKTIWLGTAPDTRAEGFYRAQGWKEVGWHGKGEIKFEMEYVNWQKKKAP